MGFGPRLLSGVFGGLLGWLEACFVSSSSTEFFTQGGRFSEI